MKIEKKLTKEVCSPPLRGGREGLSGLYIHIPFCKQACHYCDFHFSTSLKKKGELVSMLCKELVLRKDLFWWWYPEFAGSRGIENDLRYNLLKL